MKTLIFVIKMKLEYKSKMKEKKINGLIQSC